jgi:putative nucleotidyltransferase with HDIG domain
MVLDSVRYTLDKIVSTIGELPAVPAVMSAAMALTSNLEANTSDIVRVLSSDQSLTAKVLKIANSPFYGRMKDVQTVHEAVITLGFEALRSIVIAGSAHKLYSIESKSETQNKLWKHSLSVAIAGRQISEHLGHPEGEEIFIAALLHDIGKLVMLQKFPEWYQQVVDEVEEKQCSFRKIEHRVFHFDHTDVASLLLAEWGFPVPLVRAVSRHHRPPSFRRGGSIPISQVVNLANYVAKPLDVGFKDEIIEPLECIQSAIDMGISQDELDEIFEKLQARFETESRVFESSDS